MPSYCIHLAIGNLYAKKNFINNKDQFDAGLIAPDFVKDKDASHYSFQGRDKKDLAKFLNQKVMLNDYLSQNEINSDYKKGEFLHLVTDYIYFTQFFTPEYINSFEGDEFLTTMYYSYDCIKEYVETKYNVVYPGDLSVVMKSIEEKRKLLGFDRGITKPNILPTDRLDDFIEFCSNINLEEYAQKIKNENNNTYPDEGIFI